jgi:hypothetical protein
MKNLSCHTDNCELATSFLIKWDTDGDQVQSGLADRIG